LRKRRSGRLALTVSSTVRLSSESLENTNSSPEHGLRMDSSEPRRKRIK